MSSTALPTPATRIRDAAELPIESIAFGLTMLFVLMLYSTPALLVPALAPLAPAQMVGGAALGLLLMDRVMARRGLFLAWPETHLFLLFLWIAGMSIFNASWMTLSAQTSMDLAKYGVLFLLLTNLVNTERRLHWSLVTMVAGGMIPALGTIKNYATGNIHEGERVHWVGIFANPNDLAYSLVILVPIAAALFLVARPRGKAFYVAAAGTLIVAALVTFSRGGMLGLAAVLGLFGLKQSSVLMKVAVVALLVLGLVFVGAFWTRDEGFSDLTSDVTVNERLMTMRTGMEMFYDRPLLGVGIGGSVAAFPEYLPPNSGFDKALVIHNTPIMALAEVGLLGAFAFYLFIAIALFHANSFARRAKAAGNERLGRLLTGLEVSLWGFVVCGLSGGYVMSWFPYILVALVACCVRLVRSGEAANLPSESRA